MMSREMLVRLGRRIIVVAATVAVAAATRARGLLVRAGAPRRSQASSQRATFCRFVSAASER